MSTGLPLTAESRAGWVPPVGEFKDFEILASSFLQETEMNNERKVRKTHGKKVRELERHSREVINRVNESMERQIKCSKSKTKLVTAHR